MSNIKVEVRRTSSPNQLLGWIEVPEEQVRPGLVSLVVSPGLGVAVGWNEQIKIPAANGVIRLSIVKAVNGALYIDAADTDIEKLRNIWRFSENRDD